MGISNLIWYKGLKIIPQHQLVWGMTSHYRGATVEWPSSWAVLAAGGRRQVSPSHRQVRPHLWLEPSLCQPTFLRGKRPAAFSSPAAASAGSSFRLPAPLEERGRHPSPIPPFPGGNCTVRVCPLSATSANVYAVLWVTNHPTTPKASRVFTHPEGACSASPTGHRNTLLQASSHPHSPP